jgi:hypothetical protein
VVLKTPHGNVIIKLIVTIQQKKMKKNYMHSNSKEISFYYLNLLSATKRRKMIHTQTNKKNSIKFFHVIFPAPVSGQLVPMAIPLGKPRLEAGLAVGRSTAPVTAVTTSASSQHPIVTAASNVVMISVNADGEVLTGRAPELGKQVRGYLNIIVFLLKKQV